MKICVQTNPMVPRYGIDKGFEMIKRQALTALTLISTHIVLTKIWLNAKSPIFSQTKQKKKRL